MKRNENAPAKRIRSTQGVTLFEVIIVMALMGIIAMIAIPSIAQWRKNLQYRKTASNILFFLRDAKARAIERNLQYQVQLNSLTLKYGMRAGDRAYNTDWGSVAPISNWTDLDKGVNLNIANLTDNVVIFNPNGTAGNTVGDVASINIQDDATPHATKFTVQVYATGRIKVQ